MRDRPARNVRRIVGHLAAGAAMLLLAGCDRVGADWREGHAAPAAKDPPQSGYVRPPQIEAAGRAGDGGVMLSGKAEPDVRLRLASPDGGSYGATADDSGHWSIAIPPADSVRLFGLSEETGGRVVQSEGYIALLPPPGRPGVLLRAAGGAAPLESAPGLEIVSVDYDSAGGGVVSGAAQPGAPLRALVDGAAAGETHASPHGHYAMALASVIKPGAHRLQIQTAGAMAVADVTVAPPSQPISGLPWRGARVDGGWRIDWLTPGGGPQTTLVFDPGGAAR